MQQEPASAAYDGKGKPAAWLLRRLAVVDLSAKDGTISTSAMQLKPGATLPSSCHFNLSGGLRLEARQLAAP